MNLKELLRLLEERLVQHDDNRKEVQKELEGIRTRIVSEADALEDGINNKIHAEFCPVEERILGLIENLNAKLSNRREGGDLDFLMDWAQQELMVKQRYSIESREYSKSFYETYSLEVLTIESEKDIELNATGINAATTSLESAVLMLQEHLSSIHDSVKAAQMELAEICNERRTKVEEMTNRINEKLAPVFAQEDERIQSVVKVVRENVDSDEKADELVLRGKLALITTQKYSVVNKSVGKYPFDDFDLVVTREISLRDIGFEREKPTNVNAFQTESGDISVSFEFLDNSEIEILNQFDLRCRVEAELWEKDNNHHNNTNESKENSTKTLTKTFTFKENPPEGAAERGLCTVYISDTFAPSTTYCMRMRIECLDIATELSDAVEFTTTQFRGCCVWKECPERVNARKKYSIDPGNQGIAINTGSHHAIVIGNTSLPLNRVVSWNIRMVGTKFQGSCSNIVGVATSDIDQNADSYSKCGWYVDCFSSKLCSNCLGKIGCAMTEPYGITKEKEKGKHIRRGDVVSVTMDTAKGELSFGLNGVNYGVAFEGIPLDKPLVPCVVLWSRGDSVELEFLN